jgi:hypothetical protein
MTFPKVKKQAERHKPHLFHRKVKVGYTIIKKPSK